MSTARLITEERLDEWVRANYRDAQSVIVELISRLISASCPWPKNKRFPIGGGIGQHGPDGILKVDLSYEPFVPTGVTYWQIGSSLDAHRKATKDYNELTKETPKSVRLESTFIFVTPLSGRRDWECTWKKEAQLSWLKEHREENQWKDIRIIDGTVLVDWLSNFLPVELWLAKIINGLPTEKIVALDIHWEIMKTIGEPPQLDSSVFLIGREKACSKLKELFDDKITTLRLITPYPDQVVDFVAAYLARADLEERIGIVGRCLAISGVDAWNSVCTQYRNYFLVAMPDLDLSGNSDLMLLVKARAAGHRVIYGCTSAGAQDCNIADLPQPSPHQLSKTLETVGYDKERAFSVAKNCSGNLSNFLKIIQGLPLSITCATESDSSTLSIALLLGSWNEKNNEDRKIIEKIAQKPYNDWIEKARHLLHSPNSPLRYGDGIWEFVDKRTGWESLGCNIFDDYLELFQKIVVTVLREKDPKFDLPSEEQFMAQVRGKILSHSDELRTGLVESLAIMGSNPQWLTSASTNIVQKTTNISVRNVLDEADGILWASLNDILPMLAEAAPSVFISQVQLALKKKPSPFDSVYAQESSGLFGSTYITGLLWALETLAWDPDHIVTVISVLGELATHDPGGNWKNRPKNSITAILLPWLPQTCASIEKRLVAVKILLRDYPDVGWEILLTLLPKHHSVSEYTRKPTWMRIIPNDWSQHVSFEEYWKQTNNYSDLAVRIALNNNHWLVEIVDSLDDLPINYRGALLQYLESEAFINRPEEVRSRVWDALVKLINRHRVYSDAEWALNCEAIDEIQKVADRIAPKSPQKLFARLFNDNDLDLFTRKGDFQDQERDLETERETGIREIFKEGTIKAVVEFAESVRYPERVGFAFGAIASDEVDIEVLPKMMESEQSFTSPFMSGYVGGRFCKHGWPWAYNLETVGWSKESIGSFLAYLPFTKDSWELSTRWLADEEHQYWMRTAANPYHTDNDLGYAVEKLMAHGRPLAALKCMHKMLMGKHAVDSKKAAKALLSATESTETVHSIDRYTIIEIIKHLQESHETDADDLFQIELAYLSLLEGDRDASPRFLESRLTNDPKFFCEVIRHIFRSTKNDSVSKEPTETEQNEEVEQLAPHLFHLLNGWRKPPGWRENAPYDDVALKSWLETVRVECTATGHLEISMNMVGHVLAYAPADQNGLWINRSVAEVLNASDSDEIREGFSTELYNSRGVHIVDPSGKDERELATKYAKQAEDVESIGYHRLAITLRELAEQFKREAARVSYRSEFI